MYVGADYHKHYPVATTMDEQGAVVEEQVRLRNDPDTLGGYAKHLPQGSKIALAATGSWYYLYEVFKDTGAEIFPAHPLRTRSVAEARIKTDKIGSTIIAHLPRTNLLPTSYIAHRRIRDIREVVWYRASLVALRTLIKNRMHAILPRKWHRDAVHKYFGQEGHWLSAGVRG
jgi:hypothetical protein